MALCRQDPAPLLVNRLSNKGLRTDGRARCARPPAADAQGVRRCRGGSIERRLSTHIC